MDALHDWCEGNYEMVPFIAEFWNTLSNGMYIYIGLWTMFEFTNTIYHRLQLCGLSLIVIGIGSICYHGTITRWGQAFDELAILYWEVALLAVVFEKQEMAYPLIKYLYAPFAIFETVLYWQMDKYPNIGWALYHPLHVMVDIVVVYTLWSKFKALSVGKSLSYGMRLLIRGLVLIIIAFGCWLLDMFWCDTFQFLYLHAFGWHLLSGLAILHLHIALSTLIAMENGISLNKPHIPLNPFSTNWTFSDKQD